MAISGEKIHVIGIEYESGKLNKSKLAQKWKVSRNTLDKYARENGWIFGKNEQELSKKIELSTTSKMIEKSSNLLVDINDSYIGDTKNIEELTKGVLNKLYKKITKKDENGKSVDVDKQEIDALLSAQRLLKESASTFSMLFNDKRKALGLDKEKKEEDTSSQDVEYFIRNRMIEKGLTP